MQNIASRRKLVVILAGIMAITGLVACDKGEESANSAPQGMPAMPVDYEIITTLDVPVISNLTGRTSAVRTAEVRPQVSGVILKRFFKEGSVVKEGEQLYQIDPAVYEAQLASAKANLAQAEASAHSAQLRYNRYKQLVSTNAISKQDYDDAEANFRSAKAAVLAAQANVKTAEINVAYTKVYAPITGIISRSNVTEGALVTTAQGQALATIQQLDPMYLDLGQSVNDHITLRKNIVNGTFDPNKDGQQVDVYLENGDKYDQKAKLEFSEVTVDESTGMVTVRAIVPNKDQILLPGMYVRAEINEGIKKNAVVIPQISVMRQTNGTSIVYVIDKNNTVEQRVISFSSETKDKYVVTSGVQPGEKIITSNLQKIGPHAPVMPLDPNMKKQSSENNSEANKVPEEKTSSK